MSHYGHSPFLYSYVLYWLAGIFFLVGAIFAVWFFVDEIDNDRQDDRQKRRNDELRNGRTSELWLIGAVALVLLAMYAGGKQAGQHAVQHHMFGLK